MSLPRPCRVCEERFEPKTKHNKTCDKCSEKAWQDAISKRIKKNKEKTPKIKKREETRLVVVNEKGIIVELWDLKIEESIQDQGKTLKLFLKDNVDKK